MNVYITKSLGRYNFCSNDKQWCVTIRLPECAPKQAISETWPEDEEPDTEGQPPSVVIEIIAERLESYWISTGRDEQRKVIEWARQNATILDDAWAKRKIESLQRQINELQEYLAD